MTGLLPYLILLPRGNPAQILIHASASDLSSGFFGVGARIADPSDFLVQYPTLLRNFSEMHLRTSPPGNPLLFWGTHRFLALMPWISEPIGTILKRIGCNPAFENLTTVQVSSVLIQLGFPFVAGLGVLPTAALAQAWFGRRARQWVMALFPLLPGLMSFAPNFNLVYLTLSVTGIWLAWQAYARRRLGLYVAAGVWISMASFLNFGNLAFLPLNLILLGAWWLSEGNRRQRIAMVALGGTLMTLSVTSVWLGYWLIFRVSFFELYRQAIGTHTDLVRDYLTWVLYNPVDVAIWAGLVLWPAWALEAWRWPSRWATPRARLRRAFGISVVIFFVALNLAGIVLGETARILLFLSPTLLIIGAGGLARLGRTGSSWLLFGMCAQTLVVGLWLWPIQTQWQGPYASDPVFTAPERVTTTRYVLGDSIDLLGYRVDSEGGQITLFWRTRQPVAASYTVFVHAVDASGALITNHDGLPADGLLPTYCWLPDEVVADTHTLNLPAGTVTLMAGMYHWPEIQRLPVSPAQPNDVIVLGPWTH